MTKAAIIDAPARFISMSSIVSRRASRPGRGTDSSNVPVLVRNCCEFRLKIPSVTYYIISHSAPMPRTKHIIQIAEKVVGGLWTFPDVTFLQMALRIV